MDHEDGRAHAIDERSRIERERQLEKSRRDLGVGALALVVLEPPLSLAVARIEEPGERASAQAPASTRPSLPPRRPRELGSRTKEVQRSYSVHRWTGGSPGDAISKVVALLNGGVVPLMPDAVIHFVLDRPPPADRDAQTYGAEVFVPILDWFARSCVNAEDVLVASCEDVPELRLRPPQLLDRLLWFESIGYQHFREPELDGAPTSSRSP